MLDKEGLVLFAATLVLFAFITNDYYVENDLSRIAAIESIVERHTFIIDDASAKPKTDKLFINGHYYSSKPPILSLIGAAPYYILTKLGFSFKANTPVCYYLVTLSIIGTSTSILGVLFFKALRHTRLNKKQRLFLTALLLTATPIFNYTTTFNNHTVSAALVFTAFYLLLEAKHHVNSRRNVVLAGFSVGLCAGVDLPTGLLFTAIYLAYVVADGGMRRCVLYYLFGLTVPLILYAWLNLHILGDVKPAVFHPEYFNFRGAEVFTTADASIDGYAYVPRREYIFNSLIGFHGLFSNTPLLIISAFMVASTALDRKHYFNREALFLGLGCLVLGLFYLFFTSGYGGFSYSFRWLIPAIPFLLFFTATFLESKRRTPHYIILLFTAFTSFFISLIRLFPRSIAPWVGYTLLDLTATLIVSMIMAAFIVFNPSVKDGLIDLLKPSSPEDSL